MSVSKWIASFVIGGLILGFAFIAILSKLGKLKEDSLKSVLTRVFGSGSALGVLLSPFLLFGNPPRPPYFAPGNIYVPTHVRIDSPDSGTIYYYIDNDTKDIKYKEPFDMDKPSTVSAYVIDFYGVRSDHSQMVLYTPPPTNIPESTDLESPVPTDMLKGEYVIIECDNPDSNFINIRAVPGDTSHKAIGRAYNGMTYQVVGSQEADGGDQNLGKHILWYKIIFDNDQEGWITSLAAKLITDYR